MRRFVVVAPVVMLAVGDRFTTRDWPLHVTLVPTFFSEAPVPDVAAALAAGAGRVPPLLVVVGADALFGPRSSVSVSEVVTDEPLRRAHRLLLEGLAPTGLTPETPTYSGAGFRAHVTHRRHARPQPGDRLALRQVVLVDMQPGQEGGRRAVLAVAGLAGRDRARLTGRG